MKEVRCPHCNQLFFIARSADLEIKCQRCKKIVIVKIEEQSEPHR